MTAIGWHPAVLEIIAKAQAAHMHVGVLWGSQGPSLLRQAEMILNALLREGYEVRLISNDPPPVPWRADPNPITSHLIGPSTPVPPLRMRGRDDEPENG